MADRMSPYSVPPNRRSSHFPWRRGDTAELGDRGADGWKAVRVMAVRDGYAMVRIPYCVPFVVAERDLRDPAHNVERP